MAQTKKPRQFTDAEKREIERLNAEGMAQRQIAKQIGRSQDGVRRYLLSIGAEMAYKAPTAANEARRKFAQPERLELIGEGVDVGKKGLVRILGIFEKAEDPAEIEKAAKAYQNVTISLATWIDKQRLEEGLPTSYGKQDVNNTHTITYEELVNDDGARGSEES